MVVNKKLKIPSKLTIADKIEGYLQELKIEDQEHKVSKVRKMLGKKLKGVDKGDDELAI